MSGTEVTFSEADITALAERVQSQISGGFTPPLVLGHPRSDSPRVGGVFDAKAENGSLYLKVDELTPEFAESCYKGEYKYTSVSLYKDGGLRHLGVLGGANPAVKGLEAFAFGEGMFAETDGLVGGPEDVLQFATQIDFQGSVGSALYSIGWRLRSIGAIFRTLRDAIIETDGVEVADRRIPAYAITDLESVSIPEIAAPSDPSFSEPAPVAPVTVVPPAPTGEPVPAPSEVVAPVGPGSGPSVRELELVAENASLRNQIAQRAAEETSKAFSDRLDLLVDDGRLLPAQRTHLDALYNALNNGGHNFAEGDLVTSSIEGLLANMPKLVEFGELPHGEPIIHDAQAAADKITEMIAEAERNGQTLSFTEATTQLTSRRSTNGR